MPSDRAKLRQPAHPPQLAEHDARIERPTLGIAEHPLATRVAMGFERLPRLVAEAHLARLAALGGPEHTAHVALLHVELAPGQVDIFPARAA
ncbi:MAG: hypothetical protein E6J90_36260 [Deltaproteobacteria bacterium]|nr:MAG: hypothetical protein E6J90_36260 [Deltaproteobacteria bacterium]